MKRALLLFALLLTCCTPAPHPSETLDSNQHSSSTQDLRQYHPSLETLFDVSEKCPHLCWLGINPGVTTNEEALAILRASERIDQKKLHDEYGTIGTNWYFESMKGLYTYINVNYEQDLVISIVIFGTPFNTSDFVKSLGEPDKIWIDMVYKDHDIVRFLYGLYYSSRTILAYSFTFGESGPSMDDTVTGLALDTKSEDSIQRHLQPWLGFGHLQEYLPGQVLPPLPPPDPLGP